MKTDETLQHTEHTDRKDAMAKKETQKRNVPARRTSGRTKNPQTPQLPPLTISDDELYDRVARKAYELYQQRSEEPGHDLDDWLTAERLVKEELLHGPVPEEPSLQEQ
jgi:hypothetical protein